MALVVHNEITMPAVHMPAAYKGKQYINFFYTHREGYCYFQMFSYHGLITDATCDLTEEDWALLRAHAEIAKDMFEVCVGEPIREVLGAGCLPNEDWLRKMRDPHYVRR